MYKLLKVIALLLLFIACDETTGSLSDDPKNLVEPKLEITSDNITPTGSIEVLYALNNFSRKKVTYDFSSGCQFGYRIKKNNKTIYDLTKNVGCTAALTQFDIKPLGLKKFEFSIYTSRLNRQLQEGTYTLEAFLYNDNGGRVSKQFVVTE